MDISNSLDWCIYWTDKKLKYLLMSIFTLHSSIVEDYRDFIRSFFTVAGDRAREFIERELVQEAWDKLTTAAT